MNTLDEMFDKYGFADGAEVPGNAETLRKRYLKAINEAATLAGSAQEADAFDRPGLHNWCLILVKDKQSNTPCNPAAFDAGMKHAIAQCRDAWDH